MWIALMLNDAIKTFKSLRLFLKILIHIFKACAQDFAQYLHECPEYLNIPH